MQFQNGLVGFLMFGVGHSTAVYHFLGLFVAVSCVAVYHTLAKPCFQHLCFFVQFHQHTEAQLVLVGTQRTHPVAQFLGEHGYCAVNQIDTGAPFIGFAVYGCAGFHIVRHIGDMHSHLVVAVSHPSERQGVVIILCVCGVDGECSHLAEVFPAFHVFFHWRDYLFSLFLGLFGEV